MSGTIPIIKVMQVMHRGENRIKVEFDYSREIAEKIKSILGACWSKTLKAWHLPDTKESEEK